MVGHDHYPHTHQGDQKPRTWNYMAPFPTQIPRTWSKPIFHPRELVSLLRPCPPFPHLGLPLPTCSWTIPFWANVQGPRPRSRSCSRRPRPNRQRCRRSCSASNTSQTEIGLWETQRAVSVPMGQPRPCPHSHCHPSFADSCFLDASLKQSPSLAPHQGCSHLSGRPGDL